MRLMILRGLRKEVRRSFFWGILPVILFYSTGCVFFSETLEPSDTRTVRSLMQESRKSAASIPSLETANSAFQQGDLARAAEIFASLAETLSSEEGKRKALYGLACTRLAMAMDKNSFREAMVFWEKWQEQIGREFAEEDPRMLTQVLRKLASWAPSGEAKPKKPSGAPPSSGKPASTKEEEIRQKEEEIRMKDEEIERLREQLEALENIHRDIEKKKKGAASP